jgi:hypothetical protein
MPPEDRKYQERDCYPIPDRRDISLNNSARPPVENVGTEIRDFSLTEAIPQSAAAIEAKIDCDDAGENFIEKEVHSSVRSAAYARHATAPV